METSLRENPSLTVSRRYPVAPEKVWRAWTEPQALKKWWGSVSVVELDVCAGGRFRIVFGGADGKANECAGIYQEVVPGRKLVFTWHWPRTTPERISIVTLTFERVEGGTELHLRHEKFYDEAARDAHRRGWSELLENLSAALQSST